MQEELIPDLAQIEVADSRRKKSPTPRFHMKLFIMQGLLPLALLCLVQSSLKVDLRLFLLVHLQLGF